MTTTKKTSTKKAKTFTVKTKPSLDLPHNPFAFEVFDLVSRQRSKAKKIEVLKKYEHLSLKVVLIWNFDESVVSMLPDGKCLMQDLMKQILIAELLPKDGLRSS